MGISYIPGPEQILAPAFQQIMTGLQQYLQPNRAFQEKMRAEIAANPDLLQKLADLNTINPGVLNQMGFGPLTGVIGGTPQSIQSQFQQENRPAILGALKGETEAKSAASTVDVAGSRAIMEAIGKDPTLSYDAAVRSLTGETPTVRAQLPAQKAKAEVTRVQEEASLEAIKRLPPTDQIHWRSVSRRFIRGDMLPGEEESYLSRPETAAAFKAAVDVETANLDRQARNDNANRSGNGTTDTFKDSRAYNQYDKSGGVGTIEGWREFLFTPTVRQRGMALARGEIPAKTPEDLELKAIATVTKRQIDTDVLNNLMSLNAAISKQTERVEEITEDGKREAAIQSLNEMFKKRAALGMPLVTVRYNTRGLLRSAIIEYIDDKGNIMEAQDLRDKIADPVSEMSIIEAGPPRDSSGAVIAAPAAPTDTAGTGAQLDKAVTNVYQNIVDNAKDANAVSAYVFQLQLTDPSPNKAVSAAVIKRLKAEGKLPADYTTTGAKR